MSLDLPELLPQLTAAGEAAAAEARRLAELLPQARAGLVSASEAEPDELQAKVARAGERWAQAIPTDEDLAGSFGPLASPASLHLIAADGSQVYPNRHEGPLYYLINIGSIHFKIGTGEAPSIQSQPSLHYESDDLYDDSGGLVAPELINGQRDAAELAELARLAENTAPPTLALLDNGLLLWLALQVKDHPSRVTDAILKGYLADLDRLSAYGTAVAGVIDRPRHANVLGLIHLAGMALEAISEETVRANRFRGLTDRLLFSKLLPPGHRSALFRYGSPLNRDFKRAGHEVVFFYLHSATGNILRVEIPAWVADDQDRLNVVHAGILADSQSTGGFPYSLARAHEIAVIGQPERAELERMMNGAMLRSGLSVGRSSKSQAKRWINRRRRHKI
jgi:hypothetical protein